VEKTKPLMQQKTKYQVLVPKAKADTKQVLVPQAKADTKEALVPKAKADKVIFTLVLLRLLLEAGDNVETTE